LESKGKVGGASKELEEAAGAPNDPGETDAAAEVEEEEPKADLGSQIQALKNQGKGDDRVSSTTVKAGGDPDNDNMVVGAFEEIGQIEWPTPGAALTTTGIVIGIVTASTFVLLTVNSVLSSVSTAIFG
jgi:preprotein translocase SecE subunit